MKVPAMIAAELRRLTATRMSVVALVALMLVPVLYGGLYLWANQDPYGRLSEVPVALVVQDAGAQINGTTRDLGAEVADELVGSDTFDWHLVSADDANAGLASGAYDFTITIPTDFSDAIASISTDSPRQAQITLETNDANNYLATTIGGQAVTRIQNTVAEKVVSEAGLTMLDALSSIRLSLVDAADGAGQLVDGLGSAASGTTQLQTGASTLADGTAQLSAGAASLSTGVAEISTQLDRLSAGATQVADGTAQLAAIADRVGGASSDVLATLPEARDDIAATLQAQGLTEAQISDVLALLDPLAADATRLDDRVQSTVTQVDTLNAGAGQVADGSARLAAGAQTAAGGAATLATGAASAADGSAQLRDGIATLASGIDELHSGAAQLREGLSGGAAQLPDTDAETRALQAKTLGDPVAAHTDTLAEAQNYGAGLAPFFAALAGWIGIYALFLIVKPISRRAVTALRSPIRVTLAGWLTPSLLGGVGMIALFGVLSITLGFGFANPLGTLGIMLLASFTYAAIILALNVWLGSVGQFLGLVLMVLQLVTAGGTFPWQTLPAPLTALHHVLPMGYVVDAMRQLMYGGALARVGADISVLSLWMAGALVLAMIGVTRMTHRRTLRDLQPSLIG